MVEKKAYIVGRFQADFHKVRLSNLFQHETHINGRLIFQKPSRFELKLTGDVNLDIFSDGSFVALIHDGQDLEFFKAQGERDLSKFADPMMLLVNSLSNGDTLRFANLTQNKLHDSTVLDIEPGDLNEFEAVKNVKVKFSDQGTIQLIEILFQNGNTERTYFDNWSLLTQNDPKIIKMNQSIEKLSNIALSGQSGKTLRGKLQELLTASIISDAENNNKNRQNHPQN
ncbi:MAG: outer-membrane lipoprotein carrier protein LolA [Pseudomonadota bacterium]